VKISKRAGSYVTVRDLIDWVEARRGALSSSSRRKAIRSSSSTSTWRAREKHGEPVYYVPVRACAGLQLFAQGFAAPDSFNPDLLNGEKELQLASKLAELSGRDCRLRAQELAPHTVAFYLRELAAQFHSYYNASASSSRMRP